MTIVEPSSRVVDIGSWPSAFGPTPGPRLVAGRSKT